MLCAVVPAYNEEKHIHNTIQGILPHVDRLIVINDGSKDQTLQIVQSYQDEKLIVLSHRINLGKGAALKTGCMAATKMKAQIIITLDGDGQHPAEEIPAIVSHLRSHNFDIVFTTRSGGDKMPFVRRLGTFAIQITARNLYGLKVHDLWCGFRVFKTSVLPKIMWNKSDYSGEIEMCLKAAKNRLKYGEYTIRTIYNDAYKGVTITHGLKLLTQMILWRIKL